MVYGEFATKTILSYWMRRKRSFHSKYLQLSL